jgi:uncharacterized Zn-finger protein
MGFNFSRPLKITDENLPQVRAWQRTWRGRWSGIGICEDKRCPICGSYYISRQYCEGRARGVRYTCPYCQRLTVDDPWIPDNDRPEAIVSCYLRDWVRCPNCGKRFTLANPSSWNGERHVTCGQRLKIE